MTSRVKALILLGLSTFIGANERLVLSRGRLRQPLRTTAQRDPQAGATLLLAMDSPFGVLPPPGASSARPWVGADALGRKVCMDSFNCYGSVNYLTSGDAAHFLYRTWAAETLGALDDPATWTRLEDTLRVGDVVEFIAHWRAPNGSQEVSTYHVQLCVGAHGLMGGANNEPRFELVNGMPSYTQRWALCTTREYYQALRAMDPEWVAFGRPMTYSIRVYRRPWWDQPLAARLWKNLMLRGGLLPHPSLWFTWQKSGSKTAPPEPG